MSDELIICSNAVCKVAETGQCVEGLDLVSCPNYGRSQDAAASDEDDENRTPWDLEKQLATGNVLDVEDASRVLAVRQSRVVAVIGTVDAGKTSLIASVYDAFQRSSVSGLSFSGSSTLHSFEVACHDSRSASRREEAHIFRTPRGEARFYHLDLHRDDISEITSLLIADRAGEEYLLVSAEVASAKELFEVHRADTITVLVDGERLSSLAQRHNVRAEVEGIIQGLADGDALNRRQRLAVVLTKKDAVLASGRREKAESDLAGLVDSLRSKFSGCFDEISSFETAASPKKPGVLRGEGIQELIVYWMKPVIVHPLAPQMILHSRDFGRLREAQS